MTLAAPVLRAPQVHREPAFSPTHLTVIPPASTFNLATFREHFKDLWQIISSPEAGAFSSVERAEQDAIRVRELISEIGGALNDSQIGHLLEVAFTRSTENFRAFCAELLPLEITNDFTERNLPFFPLVAAAVAEVREMLNGWQEFSPVVQTTSWQVYLLTALLDPPLALHTADVMQVASVHGELMQLVGLWHDIMRMQTASLVGSNHYFGPESIEKQIIGIHASQSAQLAQKLLAGKLENSDPATVTNIILAHHDSIDSRAAEVSPLLNSQRELFQAIDQRAAAIARPTTRTYMPHRMRAEGFPDATVSYSEEATLAIYLRNITARKLSPEAALRCIAGERFRNVWKADRTQTLDIIDALAATNDHIDPAVAKDLREGITALF